MTRFLKGFMFTLFAISLIACCKNSPAPDEPPKEYPYNPGVDIRTSGQLVPPANDPRGVFYLNTAWFVDGVFFDYFPSGYDAIPRWDANTAEGQVVIEGKDSAQGTFRTKNIKISIKNWRVDYSTPNFIGERVWQSLDSDYAKFERILIKGGAWRTINDIHGVHTGPNANDPLIKNLLFIAQQDTIRFDYFVSNEKGMFLQTFGNPIPVSPQGTPRPTYIQIRFITAFKR